VRWLFFSVEKPIAVVGPGGDSAMEEANFLSRYATRVYLIHRRKEFRASKIMIDRVKANPKVEFVTPAARGNDSRAGGFGDGHNSCKSGDARKKEKLRWTGVFVAIGHDPNTTVFKGKLKTDENGYLISHARQFDRNSRCVLSRAMCRITATGRRSPPRGPGCMAALDAEKFPGWGTVTRKELSVPS